MHDDIRQSYDRIPYDALPFVDTHPDRLAAVATLFGIKPPAVERCRVLELGCASGGNLIPMAVGLPGSHFIGIDLSPRQIADGQAVIRELGLTNIELRVLNILAISADLGRFDYLVCHGVYSWVPGEVQDKILEICAANLVPNGVALVSYNTYPGWYQRRVIRDLMGYGSRNIADPLARIQQARAFLDFIARSASAGPDSAFRRTLEEATHAIGQQSDPYLLHDYLEDVNEPLYFYQFIERVKARGLQYLGDARLSILGTSHLPPEVQQTLNQVAAGLIEREQLLDFLNNQSFRRSLLCGPTCSLSRALRGESLRAFRIASLAQPMADRFISPDGLELATPDPLLKEAMRYLAEVSPWPVPFEELLAIVRQRSSSLSGAGAAAAAQDARILGARLLNCYLSGMVEMHVRPPSFRLEVGEQPLASPLARWQALRGDRLVNLRHEVVRVTELARQLLPLLDGSRDRARLLSALTKGISKPGAELEAEGRSIQDAELDETLDALARNAFLMA